MEENSNRAFSEVWEKLHAMQEWGKYPSENVVRFVARNFYKKERKKVKILDFGCGAGANTWFLAREQFDVYAFDGSQSAIDKARKYLNGEGFEDVHLSVQDGISISYEDEMFDCVIDNVCVYSNTKQNIDRMYKQIYRVLKKEGKLYSSCFGIGTLGYRTGNELEEGTYENISEGVLQGRGVAHFFTQEEFFEQLSKIGFINICIDVMKYTDNGVQVEMLMAKAEK